MSDELHIASLVLRFLPQRAAAIESRLASIAGLEIAVRGDSKHVLLCESDSTRGLGRIVADLEAIDGVINVGLVYHHAEDRAALLADTPDGAAAAGVPNT